MVFQNFNLFPHKTILDNITLAPIKLKKMSKEEAEKKAEVLLSRVGLLDKKIHIHHNYLEDKSKE